MEEMSAEEMLLEEEEEEGRGGGGREADGGNTASGGQIAAPRAADAQGEGKEETAAFERKVGDKIIRFKDPVAGAMVPLSEGGVPQSRILYPGTDEHKRLVPLAENDQAHLRGSPVNRPVQLVPVKVRPSTPELIEAAKKDPLVKLGKREWENEVARNILVLYKANMDNIRAAEEERMKAVNMKKTMAAMDSDSEADAPKRRSPKATPKRPRCGPHGKSPARLPSIKRGGNEKSMEERPSAMMKIQNRPGKGPDGKVVTKHSPTQIWYAGTGNVRAVWDGLCVADEEEAEQAMRKISRYACCPADYAVFLSFFLSSFLSFVFCACACACARARAYVLLHAAGRSPTRRHTHPRATTATSN